MPKHSKKSKHKKRRHSDSENDDEKSRSRKHSKKRSKSKRARSTSSSSSSSSSSSDNEQSTNLLKKLESKRIQDAIARKRQKDLMKAAETPEEKRARRLREKMAKEHKRRERMGWDKEYQHYTNQDNPFGDSHLTSNFVWGKKLEKHGLTNVPREELEVLNRQKQLDNKLELEKVKKRRLERELERQKRDEETDMMQRSREAAQFQEWERQEDQFHLEQARLRSKIRIQDGRAKPIDLLAQYISDFENLEESIEMQMHEPYTYLNGLGMQDLEDLLEDIKVYMELEKSKNVDYWLDLTIIVQDEFRKLQKLENSDYEQNTRREGIHQSVAKDVGDIFRGKNTIQLEELKKKIESKIENQLNGVDVGYWESLLSQLKAHMARSRLRERHQENLLQKLDLLRQEQKQQIIKEEPGGEGSSKQETEINEEPESEEEEEPEDQDPTARLIDECIDLYDMGYYSPKYIPLETVDPAMIVITESDDEKKITDFRNKIIGKEEEEVAISQAEIRMKKEAQKGMDNDEVQFSVETTLDQQVYLWSDKYRPRKPRYFNRVHTGFEWNKYNQTHYDMDNPPPKIVQGYKFNIFYPDLIDKNKTPQYFLTPCPDNKDFATLRFSAGPPYEDIAFKIVNREWEYSYKRGFRCQFHNNIFQLWFHFKRYRYRR